MASLKEKLQKLQNMEENSYEGVPLIIGSVADRIDRVNAKMPFVFRFNRMISGMVGFLLIILLLVGLIGSQPVIFSLALALISVIARARYEAWRTIDSVKIMGIKTSDRVQEKTPFELSLEMGNLGNKTIHNLFVRFRFEGSQQKEFFLIFDCLKAKERSRATMEINPNIGMGVYKLAGVEITCIDYLGIGSFTWRDGLELEIEVMPEELPVSKIRILKNSYSMHSGEYEVVKAGSSPALLGLREWRHGDNVRHIDWKRTARLDEFVVKEFEHSVATDATIIFDRTVTGHVQGTSVSTMESLRDSIISLSECFLDQRQRVQLIGNDFHIPFGASTAHQLLIQDEIYNLQTTVGSFFDHFATWCDTLPHGSVLVLILSENQMNWDELLETFFVLDDRGIDVILVVINTKAFLAQATAEANLLTDQSTSTAMLLSAMRSYSSNQCVTKALSRIALRSYILGPDQSITHVYDPELGV